MHVLFFQIGAKARAWVVSLIINYDVIDECNGNPIVVRSGALPPTGKADQGGGFPMYPLQLCELFLAARSKN